MALDRELISPHTQKYEGTALRYRQAARMRLLLREDLKPYINSKVFKLGIPLDPELSFQLPLGPDLSQHEGDLKLPPKYAADWAESYNQAVGLQGLEVADVGAELRSQEDIGGAFSADRGHRG